MEIIKNYANVCEKLRGNNSEFCCWGSSFVFRYLHSYDWI